MTTWRIQGEYLKSCNSPAACPCPCTLTGAPAVQLSCEGLCAMRICEGSYETVDLSGLSWVVVLRFPGALNEGGGSREFYIDARAEAPQRDALVQILTGKAGGPLFEIIAAVAPQLEGIAFRPVEWTFDKELRRARLVVPGCVEALVEPLSLPPGGEEQRIAVRLPGGLECRELELARAAELHTSGAIAFTWQHTFAALALVEHTDRGLVG